MTVEDLASIGVVPNMGNAHTTASFSPASGEVATPNSASGEDGDVIIYVFGDGIEVDNWETNALWRGGAGESYSIYWAGYNTINATGSIVATTGPGWLYGYRSDVPLYFQDGTQLCNT